MRYVHIALLMLMSLSSTLTIALGQGRGLRGGRGHDENFAVDRNDFHFLLEHHSEITREVKELENGVETLTESNNPTVATKIRQHVAAMYQRVEKRRPIRMRDPLFAEIFRHADKIHMQVEETPNGIRVVETSDDVRVAVLIKAHAKVVTAFAAYGFEEAHKSHAIPGESDADETTMHSGGDQADSAFVEFDREFIPALALTNQVKLEAAEKALRRLSQGWDAQFVGEFFGMFPADARWPRDLSRIAQAIALADAKLAAGEAIQAHEQLEPIRDILMEARRRNKQDYPLDALSRFHGVMEAIVKPATKLDADSLDPDQIETFWKRLREAEEIWQTVEATEFDLGAYGKDSTQQERFPEMLRAERTAISNLRAALAGADNDAVLKAAIGLKPPFAQIYMFFGDFPKKTAGR